MFPDNILHFKQYIAFHIIYLSMEKNRRISKSKYVAGLQCHKYLWYLMNDPQAIPPYDEVTEFIFQQGHDVGNLAKSMFPGGIDIEFGKDINAELAMARKLTNLDDPSSAIDISVVNDISAVTGRTAATDRNAVAAATDPAVVVGHTAYAAAASTDNDNKRTGNAATRARFALFEPAFTYKNAFARADILEPTGTDAWNIIEVKSASSIKEINKHDISLQKYCYERAGLKIDKCYLMYLNRDFIKEGPIIDPHRFFIKEDVTAEAEILKEGVEENINLMLEAVNRTAPPEISISKNCYNPYGCPLKQICWNHLPKNNVFELYRGKESACYFYQNGVLEISQINELSMLTPIQLMQYNALKENSAYIDRDQIRRFLGKLRYPLYLLDFETFATAIPLFDGLKPYQAVPFQFSCHILNDCDNEPENISFLADGTEDPRIEFLENLKRALGYGVNGGSRKDRDWRSLSGQSKNTDSYPYDNSGNNPGDNPDNDRDENPRGSIVVYYESFEKNILKKLAEAYPQNTWWIEDAISRVVDMYEPFGKFYFYSSEQKGSASLKNVLPVFSSHGYDSLAIQSGQLASLRYLNIVFLKGEKEPDTARIEKIRKDLLDYCGLDTGGMIYILKELYKIS
jgi:hypothetical protein